MKTLWKIYFFCVAISVGGTVLGIIIFSLLGFTAAFDEKITLTNEMIVAFPFFLFAIIGLYGFVYSKPILNKKSWAIFSVVFLSWVVLRHLQSNTSTFVESFLDEVWLELFWVPLYFALFPYGFFSKELWTHEKST